MQSNFSFLRGASKPEELVADGRGLGHAAMGLADRNTVAGVVRAWSQSRLSQPARWKACRLPYHPGARLVFCDGTPDILAYPRDRAGLGPSLPAADPGQLRDESPKGDAASLSRRPPGMGRLHVARRAAGS